MPFPDFGFNSSYAATGGMSAYHSLQTKVEKQFANGLNFLFTYTFSKAMTDAGDLLNGGSSATLVSARPMFLVSVCHLTMAWRTSIFATSSTSAAATSYLSATGSASWAMPVGFEDKAVGGWSIIWSTTLQGGQPIALGCPAGTASNLGCGALFTGQPLKLGLHTDANGLLSYFGNPAAFTQPCVLGAGGVPEPNTPTGCVPLTGAAALGGVTRVEGPGFHRLDLSLFKDIQDQRAFPPAIPYRVL